MSKVEFDSWFMYLEVKAEKELMMARSPPVYSCINKLDSDGSGRDGRTAYDYVIEVHYFPMVWFDLLNSFEFEWEIYLIVFLLVGVCIVISSSFARSRASKVTE